MRLRSLSLLLLLPLAACAASAFLGYKARPDYPRDRSATLVVPGLEAVATVRLDPEGVPHITAGSERDLVFAAGFMQARDRLFQMDMMRRIARGRVSELVGRQKLLGSTTVAFDGAMRGWGIDEASEADVRRLEPELARMLQAFVDGVNAGMARFHPLEYRLLRVTPEPWTMADSLAVGRLTAWGVTHNWSQELSRLLLAFSVGWERAEAIYPSRAWAGGVSVPLAGEARPLPPAVVDEIKSLFPPRLPAASPVRPTAALGPPLSVPGRFGLGSNAWVVGGQHTASGKPMVASDPHLAHLLPSIMVQVHLTCPGLDVVGVTTPGLPYVLIGHNGTVAWGMTSAVGDAVDFYVEQRDPADPERVLTPQGYRPLTRREVRIRVRDGRRYRTEVLVQRYSRNGPLVGDLYPGRLPAGAPPVALHVSREGGAESLACLRRSQRARTVAELRAALQPMPTPASVYVAADVHGRVALFASGRIPVREHHLGTFPVPGWIDRYQWRTYAPLAQMPSVEGGPEARFAHGNSLIWDPARAPFPFHIDTAPSYRLDRIVERLGATAKHDLASFGRIQADVHLHRARRIVPLLLADLAAVPDATADEQAALAALRAWDHQATAGSVATTIFFETYREAGLAAFADEIADTGREFVLAQRYSTQMMDQWFEDPAHPVWDDRRTPARETRPAVVRAAFRRAVARLTRTLGADPSRWHWGRVHTLEHRHVMGGKKVLASLVNLPTVGSPGALDSVWKAHFDLGDAVAPWRSMAGPCFRMVVDLASPGSGQWILETGASGWPRSPHYGDQRARWLRGAYAPMRFHAADVARDARATLTLRPR